MELLLDAQKPAVFLWPSDFEKR